MKHLLAPGKEKKNVQRSKRHVVKRKLLGSAVDGICIIIVM